MRTTKEDLRRRLERLSYLLGGDDLRIEGRNPDRKWTRYKIVRQLPGGGITCPFGYEQLKANELYRALNYAIMAIEIKEEHERTTGILSPV